MQNFKKIVGLLLVNAFVIAVILNPISSKASSTPTSTVTSGTYSTGKAVIPVFQQSNITYSGYYVSNITDKPIDVTVTFYNADGTLVTDDGNSTTGRIDTNTSNTTALSNYNDQNTDSTLTFTLSPHGTLYFKMDLTSSSTLFNGYGVIQWSQQGTALQGLECQGFINIINSSQPGNPVRMTLNINSGLPF